MNQTNKSLSRIEDISINKVDIVVVEQSDKTIKPKKISAKKLVDKIIDDYPFPTPQAPTLQQVTDEGNTTTGPIEIGSTGNPITTITGNGLEGQDDSEITTWNIDNGTGEANFKEVTVTSIEDANGLIKPYKNIVFKITQDATDNPNIINQYENTFGENLSFIRQDVGFYLATTSESFANFWHCVSSTVSGANIIISSPSVNTIRIFTIDGIGNFQDGMLQTTPIEFRFY